MFVKTKYVKAYSTRVEKVNDNKFIIYKNKNFTYLIKSTESTYSRVHSFIQHKKKYSKNNLFIKLLVNLKNDNKVSDINLEEIILLKEWINEICVYLLDKEQIDLKSKELLKYFKIASNFNKDIEFLICKKEESL